MSSTIASLCYCCRHRALLPKATMVAPSSLLGLYALFATSSKQPNKITSNNSQRESNKPIGRGRYSSSSGGRGRGNGRGNGKRRRPSDDRRENQNHRRAEAPLPPLTTPISVRPTYFSCRHTYEDALAEEITRQIGSTLGGSDIMDDLTIVSPHPGLICLQHKEDDLSNILPAGYNPTYALQSLPDCVIVKAESIKGLAGSVMDALLDESDNRAAVVKQLWSAPRGSLAIHALVPGCFRGVPDPPLKRRSYKIAGEVASQLKKICPAARPARAADVDDNCSKEKEEEQKWLLQILLLEAEVAAASLTKCNTYPVITEGGSFIPCSWTWPNYALPAGMAKVDIEQIMPSSAYRKLLESFWYMGRWPATISESPPVVDLGACPGGWTGALRLLPGCRVVAVDRSPLDESLMKDAMVEFISGDAFRYFPPWVESYETILQSPPEDSWMVSDIIAYPERVSELLDDWVGKRWVSHAVITCKFQGKQVPWEALKNAEETARGHGYLCHTKHFFNNKNEVTLMAIDGHAGNTSRSCKGVMADGDSGLLGEPMYPAVVLAGKHVDDQKKKK